MLKRNAAITVFALTVMFLLAAGLQAAGLSQAPVLKSPSAKVLKEAANFRPYRYGLDCKGGAGTTGAWNGGRLVALALASYAGNTAADKPLLHQVRYLLDGKNAPAAPGSYAAQHERMLTGTAVILKNTPRIWKQLTDAEKKKLDLIMKACLVASAYTSCDKNYGGGKTRPTDLVGGTNFHRGWNPNYREGIIGMLPVGACYFGPAEAQKMLDEYKHNEFLAELQAAGLTNPYNTFNYKAAHPASAAPSGKQIEEAVRGFRYMNHDLGQPMAYYVSLTKNTYGATVNAGLNNGKGLKGAGKLAKGADTLPNVGKPGMLKEFASRDAGGPRSCAVYSYDGFRPNLINQIALIVSGRWIPGKQADECVELMKVGNDDLFYKLENGYISYSKGKAGKKPVVISDPRHDYRIMRAVWEESVKPYHEAAKQR